MKKGDTSCSLDVCSQQNAKMTDVGKNLASVRQRIEKACLKRTPELTSYTPQLVAVSKTKPKEYIIEAYKHGQMVFGENYVQEFAEKASDEDITKLCPDIKWHFIGHLQRNKVNKLLSIPNLTCIQTVHSDKLADAINAALDRVVEGKKQLDAFVQVNTSREEEKSGCAPEDTVDLVRHVVDHCPNLKVVGLMTIGKYHNYDPVEGLNPDFQTLLRCRRDVCKELEIDDLTSFQLSMGMSADFEHAIEVGATVVRVGTAIFGGRHYNKTVEQITGIKIETIK